MTGAAVQMARVWPASAEPRGAATDGRGPGRTVDDSSTTAAIRAAWAASWQRLVGIHPDVELRLADLERSHPSTGRSLARLAGSAGRAFGRAVRGEAPMAEAEARLMVWERAVLDALAELDTERSRALCLDCGAANVATVAPGLTGARICACCAGEASS